MAEDKRDQEPLADAADGLTTAGQQQELDQEETAQSAESADVETADTELTVEAQIEQLEEELGQARDQALRAQAEAQNAQRRADQDIEKARKFALERFCSELLPVVDNLERALEAIDGDDPALSSIAEGVDLTLKSFVGALGKFQIEQLDPAGEPFDPQLHQAMSMIENPDAEPNTVLAVMQKGYTLNSRLVRPAMVMVSKAPAAE
ncbi:nucleotide exchange factor GrpE [Congregibacter brevis]|uniref:Protein GrpE n=1 Tax=Congregibacter brevis TaxID=3081201 RepID=A0ABZ0IB18_9GAMM|nr:nucleotide exchange factor GrpE [Congregibacter sp. IMCC45268]